MKTHFFKATLYETIIGGLLCVLIAGCRGSSLSHQNQLNSEVTKATNASMKMIKVIDKALISSGEGYFECERQILSGKEPETSKVLSSYLNHPDPIARLLAQTLIDGIKGKTNDYYEVSEYLDTRLKYSGMSVGGPPAPIRLAESIEDGCSNRVANYLALHLVKQEEDLPDWLPRGMLFYLQRQKLPSTTCALLRFCRITNKSELQDRAIDAIKEMQDPELISKIKIEEKIAREQNSKLPPVLEALKANK